MADLVFWQTLLAGGAGGAVSLGGQFLLGRQQRDNQVHALQQERVLSKADRRDEFELEQLGRARAALPAFMDSLTDFRAIEPASGADEDLAEAYIDGPVAKAYQLARRDLEAVTAEVLDDDLRSAINGLLTAASEYIGSGNSSKDMRWRMAYVTRFRDVQQLAGARVRTLYGDRD